MDNRSGTGSSSSRVVVHVVRQQFPRVPLSREASICDAEAGQSDLRRAGSAPGHADRAVGVVLVGCVEQGGEDPGWVRRHDDRESLAGFREPPTPTVFAGLDVGKSFHHLCALTANGTRVFDTNVNNDETELRAVLTQLQQRGPVLLLVNQPAGIGALPLAVAGPRAAQIGILNTEIASLEQALAGALTTHPKTSLLTTLPRVTTVSLATLIAKIGPLIERCETPNRSPPCAAQRRSRRPLATPAPSPSATPPNDRHALRSPTSPTTPDNPSPGSAAATGKHAHADPIPPCRADPRP